MRTHFKNSLTVLIALVLMSASMPAAKQEYYLLKIYSIESEEQEKAMDNYLENAFVPALHNEGYNNIGAFKTIEGKNDGQNLFVLFIPMKSLKEFEKINELLSNAEDAYITVLDFADKSHENPPYGRIETILLSAFSATPIHKKPALKSDKSNRIYELRSYQSATEVLHLRKVMMFDKGESQLFIDLGFQPLFFGKVLVGADMPNLMYMTCHENEDAQSENWKKFVNSDEWKEMKDKEIYQNTVSHIDKWMLYPLEYSDL